MPGERHFRAFARRTVALSAVLGDSSGAARPVQVINLGLGGACVEVQDTSALSPGNSVTLELPAQALWDPLLVPARIAWTKPAGPDAVRAGLAFQHTGPAAMSGLIELLGSFR